MAGGKDREEQDDVKIKQWVDPHQLKWINGQWEKEGRRVVTAKSPITQQIITIITISWLMATLALVEPQS